MDQTIPFEISDFLWCLCEVVGVLAIIVYSTPMFATVLVPLFIIYYFN